MYNFGKIPPRAIQGSGVASVLGEDCRVFYDNLFNSAGLGRVSDLLSSRLRAFKLDELKLRALLLFSFFEAYREQSVEGALDEPLVIECGMDDEKVAVGVTFSLKNAADLKVEGLQERVSQFRASHPFEALIGMLYANSDHTILRVNLAQGRIEIISLLAIPGKFEMGERQPLTIIDQSAPAAQESVKAKEYVQLADLEYAELLKEEGQKARKKGAFSTGEILSKRFSAPSADKSKTVVKGGVEEDSADVRISTGAESKDSDVVRISAANPADSNKPALRLAHSAHGTVDGDDQAEGQAQGGTGFSVQALLKKVWPFKRKKLQGEAGEEPAISQGTATEDASAPAENAAAVAVAAPAATAEPEKPEGEEGDENDPKVIAQHLSQNFASGSFSQFVDRTQKMAHDLKRESKDLAAQRWAEGLSQQVMAEKVRLAALSQKINQAIRQKEQDLKKREQKFAEDLRRKEEALHQKTAALNRAKEQVAQLTAQIEKQKGAKAAGGEDAAGFKHKYQLSQRMILNMREENTKLVAKLEELKAQGVSTQKVAESSAQVELANLKSKQDQMLRQNMQLKSLNEQLMRKMSQSANKASEKNDRSAVEEMKKKYESAAKQAEQSQKDLTQLKGKLDKLTKEETRWMTDLAKKEAELRRAKAELEQLQASQASAAKAEKADKADKSEKPEKSEKTEKKAS